MKNCPNCGSALDDNAAFCTNCGAKLDQVTPAADPAAQQPAWPTFEQAAQQAQEQNPLSPEASPAANAGYQQTQPDVPAQNTAGYQQAPGNYANYNPQPPVQNGNYAPYPGAQPPKKKRTGLIVALVIVGVLVLAIIAGIVAVVAGTKNVIDDYAANNTPSVSTPGDEPDTNSSAGSSLLDETSYLTDMTNEVLGMSSVMDDLSTFINNASGMDELNSPEFLGYLDTIDDYCNKILALTPPAGYEEAHDVLADGLNDILSGTSCMREAVNNNDPNKLSEGADYFLSASEKITDWQNHIPS